MGYCDRIPALHLASRRKAAPCPLWRRVRAVHTASANVDPAISEEMNGVAEIVRTEPCSATNAIHSDGWGRVDFKLLFLIHYWIVICCDRRISLEKLPVRISNSPGSTTHLFSFSLKKPEKRRLVEILKSHTRWGVKGVDFQRKLREEWD